MPTGRYIERARQHGDVPIYIMCNAMDLLTESEYKDIVNFNKTPSIYQQIMVICAFEDCPEILAILCE